MGWSWWWLLILIPPLVYVVWGYIALILWARRW